MVSLALWAAQRFGKPSQAADTYAGEIVALDVANPKRMQRSIALQRT